LSALGAQLQSSIADGAVPDICAWQRADERAWSRSAAALRRASCYPSTLAREYRTDLFAFHLDG